MKTRNDKIVAASLVLIGTLAVLVFGFTEPDPWGMLCGAVLIIGGLYVAWPHLTGRTPRVSIYKKEWPDGQTSYVCEHEGTIYQGTIWGIASLLDGTTGAAARDSHQITEGLSFDLGTSSHAERYGSEVRHTNLSEEEQRELKRLLKKELGDRANI